MSFQPPNTSRLVGPDEFVQIGDILHLRRHRSPHITEEYVMNELNAIPRDHHTPTTWKKEHPDSDYWFWRIS